MKAWQTATLTLGDGTEVPVVVIDIVQSAETRDIGEEAARGSLAGHMARHITARHTLTVHAEVKRNEDGLINAMREGWERAEA